MVADPQRYTRGSFLSSQAAFPVKGNRTFLSLRKGFLLIPEGSCNNMTLSFVKKRRIKKVKRGILRTNWESQKAIEYFLIILEKNIFLNRGKITK